MSVDLVWLYDGDHLRHPFLRQAAESLARAGYALCVLDRSPERSALPYDHRPLPSGRGRLARALFLAVLSAAACARRPRAFLGTVPSAGAAAWLAARLRGGKFIYFPFELYGEQSARFSPALKRLEAAFLRRGVDLLITQNPERARVYVAERGARVEPVVVRNFKPAKTRPPGGKLRAAIGAGSSTRLVLYEGQLVAGRALDALVRSVRWLPDDVTLVLMGEETPWSKRNIRPLLAEAPIAGRVVVAPWVPDRALLDHVVDADVGVIIYDRTGRNNYFCEPGKLSDYVQAGIPVVAPDFPTIGPLVQRYGIGALFSSLEPPAIAAAVRQALAMEPSAVRAALARASAELVWETQEPVLLGAVSGILETG